MELNEYLRVMQLRLVRQMEWAVPEWPGKLVVEWVAGKTDPFETLKDRRQDPF